MTEPYAYEVTHEDAQELVYAGWLAKFATDEYRASPRIPLYKQSPLTDDQRIAIKTASDVLENLGYLANADGLRSILFLTERT